jgi:hypothetical protein
LLKQGWKLDADGNKYKVDDTGVIPHDW